MNGSSEIIRRSNHETIMLVVVKRVQPSNCYFKVFKDEKVTKDNLKTIKNSSNISHLMAQYLSMLLA